MPLPAPDPNPHRLWANVLAGNRWYECDQDLLADSTVGQVAQNLADKHLRHQPDGTTWGLKIDGHCPRLDSPFPADARTVELVDVTGHVWDLEPADESDPAAEPDDPDDDV